MKIREYVEKQKNRFFEKQGKEWHATEKLMNLLKAIGIQCDTLASNLEKVLQEVRKDTYYCKERWEMENLEGDEKKFFEAFKDLGFLNTPDIPTQEFDYCLILGARVATMQERAKWADQKLKAKKFRILSSLRDLVDFEKKSSFFKNCSNEFEAAKAICTDFFDRNWDTNCALDHRVNNQWRRADTSATAEQWAREEKPEEGDSIVIVSHAPFALRQGLSTIRPLLTMGFQNLDIAVTGYITDNPEQKLNVAFLEVIGAVHELTVMGELKSDD